MTRNPFLSLTRALSPAPLTVLLLTLLVSASSLPAALAAPTAASPSTVKATATVKATRPAAHKPPTATQAQPTVSGRLPDVVSPNPVASPPPDPAVALVQDTVALPPSNGPALHSTSLSPPAPARSFSAFASSGAKASGGAAKGDQADGSGPAGLAAPTGLTATPDNGLINLSWTGSAGAAYYEVYESSTPNAPPASYTDLGAAYGTTYSQQGLSNGVTYSYYVVAYNNTSVSPDSNVASATPGLPAPTGVSASAGNGQITVTWTASTGSGVTGYNIFESATQNGTYAHIGDVPAGTLTYTQNGLTNGKTYYYYVVADNNGGVSPNSSVASAQVVLPPPTGLTATLGNGAVTLNWTASAAPGASFYNVYASTSPTSGFTQIGTAYGTSYIQSGLSNAATYYYYLVPVNNGGVGTQSATASATLGLAAPTGVAATPGDGSVTVTWNASTGNGVASYNVFEATSLNGTYANVGYVAANGSATYSFTQSGLTNGTTYYYYVVANNNGSVSPHSATVNAQVSLPPPTGLTATVSSNTVSLTWTASAAPGASYYQVYQSSAASPTPASFALVGTTSTTSFTQGGLKTGKTYTYYVVPVNSGGAGTPSANATAPAVTSASTSLTATPGAGLITLNWTGSADSYEIYESTNNYNFYDQGNTTATTFTKTGLSNGATYYFYYVPYTGGVAGPQSATVSALVQLPPPTSITATTGAGSITLNWTASAFPYADSYEIYESTNNYNFYDQGGTAATTFTKTGLSNGQTYEFYIVPLNAGGSGTQSATTTAIAPGLPPPTNLAAVAGAGSITLTWTASAAPGATSYEVYSSTNNYNFYDQGATTKTTFSQTGLTNGVTYYYYIVPSNAGGNGTASATVSAQPGLPAPTNLTAATGDGSITLNWTASAAPGATNYEVYSSTNNYNFYDQGGTAGTTFTQTGLTNGTTYYYYIIPSNAGGNGIASATVSAQVGLPAPTGLTATAGAGSVTLNWTASAFPYAKSYEVYSSTNNYNFYDQGATTKTTFTQTGLSNNVTYYYYIVPYNDGAGPGTASATVSALVNLPPPTGLTATLGAGQVTLNWTASAFPGADSYNVYQSTNNYNFYYQGNTTATNYVQTGLTNGTTYYYFLIPVNAGGNGTQSATVAALVGLPPPTNLVATPGEGQITLTWTASAAPGADSYEIYRSTNNYNFYDQGNTTATTYVDTGLTDGVTYYYYLVPINGGSVGTQSATVSATPGLAAPTGLTATPGATSITLHWTAPTTPGLTGYHVYRSTALNGSYTLIGSPTTTTYTDTGLPGGTTYYYYVTAYNTGNESPPSNKASATTTAPDVTPPTTSITAGPADGSTSCSGSVTFTWTGTDNRTPTASLVYEYSLDGVATAFAASTTATFNSLADGAHTFTVKAKDQAGNVDPNGATSRFTVDTTAPVISNVAAVLVTASGAHITWTTDKPATSQVDYRLQGATTWTSTPLDTAFVTGHDETISGLSLAKTYEFRVRSADGCSNTTVSAIQTFTTTPDTTAPTTSITGGPADNGTACQNTVTFTFTGTDNVTPASGLTYKYSVDGGAYSAPSASTTATLNNLTAGAHTFTVKAVDAAGNADPSGVTVHFTVDLAGPVVSAVGTAPLDVRATITWTTDIPSSSQVDFGPTASYGSSTPLDPTLTTSHSVTVSGLSPSTAYHFRVRSKDACREGDGPDGTFSTTVPLLPNLEVTALSFNSPAKAGDTVNVSYTVTNVGPGDASGQWSDTLYLSSSSTPDGTATPLGTFPAPNALQGGQFYSQSQSITLPNPLPAGTYYLIVQADSGNAVKETNKNDDTLAQRLDITKIQTLLVTPDQNPISLVVNAPVVGTLNLSNVTQAGKTGIKATVVGAPANVTVQVVPPTTLAAMTGDTAQITVTAKDDSTLNSSPVIHFTDDQGDDTTATLNITVAPHRPNLVADPGSINVGMVRGQQTVVTVNVTNTGSAAASGLTVAVPQAPWLALSTPASIGTNGTLAPGQTAQIVLTLTPDASLPLGLYNGTIGVNGSNAGLLVNATFNCISAAKGSLKVTATDEFTYFADTHPPVVGAQITVTDAITGAVVAQGVSDQDGLFSQTGIPEGTYNIQSTDAGHGTDQSQVTIMAAQETDYTAFLPRQLVTYSWTVEPVGVTDQYQIVLQADFETHVPAPVVTVSPTVLDATALSYDANNQATVYFTVTNHGLIAGDDTHLELPSDPRYSFQAATTDLGSLPALSTILVPVVVTRLGAATAGGSAKPAAIGFGAPIGPDGRILAHAMAGGGGGGGCTTAAVVIYHYNCKGKRTGSATVNILVGNCGGYGLPNIPYNPGSGNGPGFLPTGGNGQPGGSGSLGFTGVTVKTKQRCKPLPPCTLADAQAIANCILGFIPGARCPFTIAFNVAQCVQSLAGASSGSEYFFALEGCLAGAANSIAGCITSTAAYPIGALTNAIGCYTGISPCDPFGAFGGGGGGAGGSGGPGGPGGPPVIGGPPIVGGAPGDPGDDAVRQRPGAQAVGARQIIGAQKTGPQKTGVRAMDTTTTSDGDSPFAANSPYYLNLVKQGQRAMTVAQFLADAVFGDKKWLSGTTQDEPAFAAFLQAYNAVRDPKSDSGSRITDAEAASLKSLPLPAQLTSDDVQALVARWNRTLDYHARGIAKTTDVPAGQSTDFFAVDTLSAEAQAAQDAQAGAIADGYTDPYDGLHQAELAIQAELDAPDPAGTCATVKIELDQTVTLTRTAFKATLKLDNAPQNVALSNIAVSLKVTDMKGNDASGVFGISAPKTTGFVVDGTGTLQPGTSGSAAFTLLPAHEAAATGDTTYLVSGTLSYTQSGATVTIPLFPVQILVKPDPFLQFHYFLQRDVYGPDPFDGPNVPEKPEEPFSLGLLVKNAGLGTARNFDIATAQPKIVDNEKGLLIAFQLIGTQINSQPVTPALDINLGDIAGNATSVAQFLLTASLAGKFIDFTAQYTHVDDLGNPRTSLIDSIDTHLLSHVVRIDSPADDGKPDFLADDLPDVNNTPDTIWDSVDASHTHVFDAADAAADGPATDANNTVHVTFTPPSGGGYVYAQIDDPGQGNYRLAGVMRSDGKVIRLGDNAWLTSRVIRLEGQAPYVQNRLYLFDESSTGSYTVTYAPPAPTDANAGLLKQHGDGAPVIFGGSGSSGSSGSNGGSGTGGTGTGGGTAPDQPLVVTAALPDGSLYAENPDRSSGIRIVPEAGAGTASEGQTVRGTGTLRTAPNGERYIDAHSLAVVGTGSVSALGLTTKSYFGGDFYYNAQTGAGQQGMTDGAGLTSVGLLTATVGKVLGVSAGAFTLSDGYGQPIQVAVPSGVTAPSVGDYVGVTGVDSIFKSGGTLTPLLIARRASDITTGLGTSMAQTFTTPAGLLNVGDNLLGLPGIPLNPAPASVLSGYTAPDGSGLVGRLIRYDFPTQAEVGYGPTSPNELFDLLNGEGYRFRIKAGEPTSVAFTGLPADYADRWLPLPVLGAARIGDPFNVDVDWSSVLVNDGTQVVPLQNAAQTQFPPWLSSKATYFDSATQKSKTLGLPSDKPDSTMLLRWHGYTVTTSKPNGALALIVPAAGVPTPTLTALSPNSALAGGLAFTLTVTGQNFLPSATVFWNGSMRPTAYVSATQLTAQITAGDIQNVAPVTVTAANTPAGTPSNGLPFAITAPALSISSLEPATVAAGSPDFPLIVHGSGFLSGARVTFNGKAITPTSVTGKAITFTVHQGDIAKAGAYPVTLDNGAGTTAASANLLVGAPLVNALTPTASTLHAAGDPPLSLTVAGASFVPGTTVTFDGHALTPSAASATSLTVSVPSSYLTTARTVTVSAVNPGGQASNTKSFAIGNPRLTVTEKTTSTGGGSYTVTLTISNSGATDATGVKITRATLNGKAGTPIPQTVGTVAAGGQASATLTFAGATQKSLALTITYTGGSVSPLYPNP